MTSFLLRIRTLGLGGGNTIVLDTNAAGRGWFIDSTSTLDEEFDIPVAATESRAPTGPVVDRVDLITVMMHEFGHLLGLHETVADQNSAHSLFNDTLGVGTRRTLSAAELNMYFDRLGR
jgi:hypothetical protein